MYGVEAAISIKNDLKIAKRRQHKVAATASWVRGKTSPFLLPRLQTCERRAAAEENAESSGKGTVWKNVHFQAYNAHHFLRSGSPRAPTTTTTGEAAPTKEHRRRSDQIAERQKLHQSSVSQSRHHVKMSPPWTTCSELQQLCSRL
jgi:hypothetical protein